MLVPMATPNFHTPATSCDDRNMDSICSASQEEEEEEIDHCCIGLKHTAPSDRTATCCSWSDVRVGSHIGSGAFCMVLKAMYRGKTLAIKCVKEGDLDSKIRMIAMKDLQEEARILSALKNHPNIVDFHATGAIMPQYPQDSPFFLMERLRDETLETCLRLWRRKEERKEAKRISSLWSLRQAARSGKNKKNEQEDVALSPLACCTSKVPSLSQRLSNIALKIIQVLDYLHKNRIVHCDIKPSNIGFGLNGEVKLFDFGLSKILSPSQTTMSNNPEKEQEEEEKEDFFGGSLRYMAPEVMLDGSVSFAADIYSFSLVLWELVTLEKPHGNVHNPKDLIVQVATNNGQLDLDRIQCSSPRLRKVVRTCWNPKANDRPSSSHVAQELNGVISELRTTTDGGNSDNRYSEKSSTKNNGFFKKQGRNFFKGSKNATRRKDTKGCTTGAKPRRILFPKKESSISEATTKTTDADF